MFRVIKTDGTELGVTDAVYYIKIGASGCFTPTVKEDAIGVAYNSIAYNLAGHTEIANADTVVVSAIDSGILIDALNTQHIETEQMLTDLDIANIEAQQAVTDLELMILEG